MDTLDLLLHLLNFFAPAFGLALLMATLAKLVYRRPLAATPWRVLAGRVALAVAGVLVLGLVITGQDGRMLTWGGAVIVSALVPWWSLRGR